MPIWGIAWWVPSTAAPKSSAAGTTCVGSVSYTHLDVYKRQAPFGLEVEVLSRFRTPAQQKRALKAFAEGTIDVLIGTCLLYTSRCV